MFRFLLYLALGACWISSARAQSVAEPGRLSGRVLDDEGKAIAGITLTLHRAGDTKPITLAAAADGRYEFSSLTAGSYRVCIRGPIGSLVIDPCLWPQKASTLTVRAGVPTAFDPVAEIGSRLQVRVNDPGKNLEYKPGRAVGPSLSMVGVWNAQHLFYPMQPNAPDASGRTYQMPVPFGQDMTVVLTGPAVRVEIDGKDFNSKTGIRTRIRLTKGASEKPVVLNVIGPDVP